MDTDKAIIFKFTSNSKHIDSPINRLKINYLDLICFLTIKPVPKICRYHHMYSILCSPSFCNTPSHPPYFSYCYQISFIFDVWLTVHRSSMWNKKPTRCHLVLYLFLLYKLLNLFRATLSPSSGADDLVIFFRVWCSAMAV